MFIFDKQIHQTYSKLFFYHSKQKSTMATACYPRKYSFVAYDNTKPTEDSKKEKTGKVKPLKPHPNAVICRNCRYHLPYLATKRESNVMLKVADVTGPKQEIFYYCPSSAELLSAMDKLRYQLDDRRYQRLCAVLMGVQCV
jgi:hypothetical protein